MNERKHVTVWAFRAEGAHAAAIEPWLQAAAHALREKPGVRQVVTARAVTDLAAGRALGEFTPSHIALIETAGAGAPDLGPLPAGLEADLLVQRGFHELYPANREGEIFREARPRTIFVILQEVRAEDEAAFNYWFDVDDGSAAKTGGAIIGHLTERLSYPGFIRGTRFTRGEAEGRGSLSPNYLTLYELDSPDALQSPSYTAAMRNASSVLVGGDAAASPRKLFRLLVRHAFVEF